ncbi:RWD domain-containing protein [Xylaria bambusicola]|uniref:RWD domain-containing protein n=1 Tax=Xylaria bambusicola TaxID=326684 RepID=UPI0020085B1D|nr:RWD domain-containing protein [Xylaria bambusicola]KAI0526142.1 RWD domain-containing protein [Xylaria bambusicola]
MGKEDQIEEREVLESIFPEEITDISDTEYRIAIKLNPPSDDNDEEEVEPPTLNLHVRYPEAYPDEAPILDLSPVPNAPVHPRFSVAVDKGLLLKGLDDTIQESLGMAMVFTLVTTLTELAEQLITDRKEAADRVREEALLAAEREENKKFQGTPVTPETFLKWREEFRREMEEQRQREEEERLAELKKAKVKEAPRLTGKQLWERGLVGKGEEEDDEPPTEQVEKLKVAA